MSERPVVIDSNVTMNRLICQRCAGGLLFTLYQPCVGGNLSAMRCRFAITLVHSNGSEIGNVVLKLRPVPNSLSSHLVREARFTKMGKVEIF